MLDKVIHFSIKNKLIIGIFTLALIIWGSYSLKQLPIDAVPDITNNQVQIITTAPTLAAQEVEKFITAPIEYTMATAPDIIELRSISRFGLSVITVVFKDQVDIYKARQYVTERLKEAEAQIPNGIARPELAPVSTGLGEIYQYTLHTKPGYEKKYDAMALRTIQDWIVRRQLLGTPGVADVSSFGGYLKQYEVAVDPARLRSMNITMDEIFKALAENNENTGGAYIDKKPNAYFIRGIGLAEDFDDIENSVVKTNQAGIPVLIRDVAKVQFGFASRYGAMTRNDEGEVVGALVLMLKGENSAKVIKNVKEKIAAIEKTLPKGVTIEPFIDRTKLVDKAIYTVAKNLIEGALIVIFVLVLMLGNLRAGLVVASVIPLAMLFAISMMNLFGVSGNLMSLGAIDFGLIVDGAVIIVEATMHHLGLSKVSRLTQKQMDEEVYESASKIRSSAAFGEIIILIVYLPILALVGIEGKMFGPMAQTVAFAILGAFILSLTYVPMASALFLSKNVHHKKNISDKLMDFFQKIYDPVIRFAIDRKAVVVSVAVVLLAVSLFIFSRMGGEFIPTLEEGDFAVETRVLAGSSLSQTVEASLKAGGILKEKFPEVKQVVGRIGASEIPTDPMPIEAADLIVILKDKDEWTSAQTREELAEKMGQALQAIPGVEFGFQQPIQMRFNELMTGARQDVAIKIFGEDMDLLLNNANKVSQLIRSIKGVEDIYVERVSGLPQIQVKYKRDKLAIYGLTIADANRVLRTAFAGESAGVIFEGEKRFDLVVRLDSEFRKNIDDISNLFILNDKGDQVPIGQVADIVFEAGPAQVSREDAKRRITVGFNVRNRDVESIVGEIKQKLNTQLKLPTSYYLTYGGQFENLIQAKERLSIAVPVALFLILTLLYFTFNSIKQTLLIFSAIPMSAIGGIFALWIRDMPFSISAGIGFIALFGVAVLNGIVLIGYFNQLKAEGVTDLRERVLKGTQVRLRPVLMTALVASLGFLPMALSSSEGAEVQKPLATVVIGGLVSATLLTLVVVPVLYMLFTGKDKPKPEEQTTGEDQKMQDPSLSPAVILIFFSLGSLFTFEKASAQAALQKMGLEQITQQAIQNNGSVRTGTYEVSLQKSIKRTSSDIGKTNVSLLYGQYNSLSRDNNITITQSIPFPTVISTQAALGRANIRGSELRLAATKNQVTYNVRSLYYQLLYLKARQRQLEQQDSIFTQFAKASELRFKTGETNLLEKSTAESRLLEVKTFRQQNKSDIEIAINQLQTLLNSQEPVDISDSVLVKREFNAEYDSVQLANNPLLAYFRQQIEVGQRAKALEKSRLLPDFTLGYFSQTLQGNQTVNGSERYFGRDYRFQGLQVGVSIPLWIFPQRERIKGAEINRQIAQSNFDYERKNLEGQYKQAIEQYLKFKNSLNYYQQNGLPTADLIIQNAQKGFQSGAIGYVEVFQALNQALSVKFSYLDVLNEYNQALISIEYLLSNNKL
jgi:cobalt-zinc-cadmium resistance protein CzcA